jgi:hypothetical protein
MNIKSFIIILILVAFGIAAMAQSQEAPAAAKKDVPAQTISADKAKTGDCAGHQTSAKADCKWVDANNDGLCDVCGSKECKDKKQTAAPKSGAAAPCPHYKDCGAPSSCGGAKGAPDKK